MRIILTTIPHDCQRYETVGDWLTAHGQLRHVRVSEMGNEDYAFLVGLHEMIFDSPNDRIYLCHDAKSRRGYAEGAVLGAEWLSGKTGFYEFKDIWRQV